MIRRGTTRDLDSILEIWLSGNLDAHAFIPASYWKDNAPLVKELLGQADLYVFEEDSTIKGFAGLQGDYLAGLFVSKSARSKGIGKALLDYLKSCHEELTLHVYQENERALTFYVREGFTQRTSSVDDATGHAELEMVWTKKSPVGSTNRGFSLATK